MKITRKRLKSLINEAFPGYASERPNNPMERAYAKKAIVDKYEAWSRETGHITPAASSVLATYLVDQELAQDTEQMSVLANEYKMDKTDVAREVKRALAEYEAGGLESEEDNYEYGFFRESKMKITKRQLRRIIRESLLNEGTLYIQHGDYGYIGIEDDAQKDYPLGELVSDLIASGDTDFFYGPQGIDEEALQKLQTSIDKGVQGGVERWDSDVFGTYYNVDTDRVFRLWARGKNLNIEEVEVLPSEREEYEDDGTNDFEEYYS